MNKELSQIRKEIDDIDAKLIQLFKERMRCSDNVAKIKEKEGIPVFDKEREASILKKVKENAGEYGNSIAVLYAAMMSASRMRQYRAVGENEIERIEKNSPRKLNISGKISCQGAEGACSHKAALMFLEGKNKKNEIVFKGTWNDVFEDVSTGYAEFGILPVENSSAGSVYDVYELIMRYRLYIVGVVAVKVSHCIASSSSEGIKKVISHPQALAQCSSYISKKGYEAEEFSNTALAAKYVKEHPGTAAICSEEAANECGLKIIQRNIQNESYNTTRFIVISKTPILPDDSEKISICFALPHTAGSLYNILERFAIAGSNLTKIESFPVSGSKFEYKFYLDFTGNIHDEETLNLIKMLSVELPEFSFLGNYKEIE